MAARSKVVRDQLTVLLCSDLYHRGAHDPKDCHQVDTLDTTSRKWLVQYGDGESIDAPGLAGLLCEQFEHGQYPAGKGCPMWDAHLARAQELLNKAPAAVTAEKVEKKAAVKAAKAQAANEPLVTPLPPADEGK